MQIITLAGNVSKDAVLRRTQDGEAVLGFSVAVNDYKKKATFYDCSLWGKRGSALEPHITKGSSVTVIGELGTREHEGKTYLTVRVSEVALQGGKGRSRDDEEDSYGNRSTGNSREDLSDDLPF